MDNSITKIEPDKKFIRIGKTYNVYGYETYTSNNYSEFHIEEDDWNMDGNIYPLEVAYFYDDDYINCPISKKTFENSFFEINEDLQDDRMFMHMLSGIVFNIVREISYDGEKLVFLNKLDGTYEKLITLKTFKTDYTEITFK